MGTSFRRNLGSNDDGEDIGTASSAVKRDEIIDETSPTTLSQPDTTSPRSSEEPSFSVLADGGGEGERIASLTSETGDIEEEQAAKNPSDTASPPATNDVPFLPQLDPSLLAPPDLGETAEPSALADRRGQHPQPVRFAVPNIITQAASSKCDSPVAEDPAEDSLVLTTTQAALKKTATSLFAKLDLLPAVIALRDSARPGSNPTEARKALELAVKARESALARGAGKEVVGQCNYYMAVANFATGDSNQEPTMLLFEDAVKNSSSMLERDWAESWRGFVQKAEQAKMEEQAKASRPSSMLSMLSNPLGAVVSALRLSGSSSKAPVLSKPIHHPGLLAQVALAQPEALRAKPAAQRMILSTSPNSTPRELNTVHGSIPHRPHLPSWNSDQSSRPVSAQSARSLLPTKYVPRRDSQGNFDHFNTGWKYNEDHPYGIAVEFVESPEEHEHSDTNPRRSVPPRKRLVVKNPDPVPRSKSMSSASVVVGAAESSKTASSASAAMGAAPNTRASSASAIVGAAPSSKDGEEEESVAPIKQRRRGSWIQSLRISMKSDREASSPTKSLEAMVEEGESPMFKPKDFGIL